MAIKPIDLGKYNAKELEEMEIRELEALAESWTRALSANPTEAEIDAIRLANRIFIRRREAMRKAAPAMLAALEGAISILREVGLDGSADEFSAVVKAAKEGA